MTISTLRKMLFGTLALATLLSVMLTGGSNDASAASIHKPNLQAVAAVFDHFNPNSVDCNSSVFAINITIRNVDTI